MSHLFYDDPGQLNDTIGTAERGCRVDGHTRYIYRRRAGVVPWQLKVLTTGNYVGQTGLFEVVIESNPDSQWPAAVFADNQVPFVQHQPDPASNEVELRLVEQTLRAQLAHIQAELLQAQTNRRRQGFQNELDKLNAKIAPEEMCE